MGKEPGTKALPLLKTLLNHIESSSNTPEHTQISVQLATYFTCISLSSCVSDPLPLQNHVFLQTAVQLPELQSMWGDLPTAPRQRLEWAMHHIMWWLQGGGLPTPCCHHFSWANSQLLSSGKHSGILSTSWHLELTWLWGILWLQRLSGLWGITGEQIFIPLLLSEVQWLPL